MKTKPLIEVGRVVPNIRKEYIIDGFFKDLKLKQYEHSGVAYSEILIKFTKGCNLPYFIRFRENNYLRRIFIKIAGGIVL